MRFLMIIFLCVTAQASSSQPDAISSKIKSLNSEYTLVQVWATFCEPCGEEVKELNTALEIVNKSHTDKKLSVLGVPVQSRKKEIAEFVEHFKPNYEQLMLDSSASDKFLKNNTSVPLNMLFSGKEKSKVKEWRGKITTAELLKEIEQLDQKQKKGNL